MSWCQAWKSWPVRNVAMSPCGYCGITRDTGRKDNTHTTALQTVIFEVPDQDSEASWKSHHVCLARWNGRAISQTSEATASEPLRPARWSHQLVHHLDWSIDAAAGVNLWRASAVCDQAILIPLCAPLAAFASRLSCNPLLVMFQHQDMQDQAEATPSSQVWSSRPQGGGCIVFR